MKLQWLSRLPGASAAVTSVWFSSSSAGPGPEAVLAGKGGGMSGARSHVHTYFHIREEPHLVS